MRKRNFSGWSVFAVAISLLVLTCVSISAAEFTANLNDHEGDQVKTTTFTLKDSFYRMDLEESGEKISVIVDQSAGFTNILLHSEKTFMKIKSQDHQSLMNDPFQAVIYMADNGEVKQDGTEIAIKWVSQKYNFPVKIKQMMAENKFVEITDIVEGPVDETLFQIPEDYSKWIDPEDLPVEIPEWAKDLSSQPAKTPPFEKDMVTGEILRIPVTPAQSIWVKGQSSDESEAVARAIPFKDGRPNKKPSWYNNFAMQGTICTRNAETSIEADEIVLYVFEGNVHVNVKLFPMKEEIVKEGGEYRFLSETYDNIETRFVNSSEGESECFVSFFKDGVDVSEGPAKYRTFNLEKKGDIQRSTYSTDMGKEVVIKVTKGEMVIKMGQYDTFKF